jgi:O-antigen/teichoic acid export membrane protein
MIIFGSSFFQKSFLLFAWFQKIIMFKKILSNTAYQIIWKVITALISIFLLNLLTNYLPIELFGEYWKVYNYLLIFAFLADLWLYTISIREIQKHPEDCLKIVGNILSLRLLLGVIVILISLFIAQFLPAYNSLLTIYSIAIVWVFTLFSLVNSSILALMQAHLKMWFSIVSSSIWKGITFLCIVAITQVAYPKTNEMDFFMPFIAIMLAGLVWNIAMTVMNYMYAKRICDIRFKFDYVYIKDIFITSIPYWIAIFLGVVYTKVDIIFLSLLESPNKANISIALYSVPMKIMEVFMMTGTFFLNSLLPSMTQAYNAWKKYELESLLKTAFLLLLAWSTSMLVFGLLLKDIMIEIIATSDYLDRNIYEYTSSDAFIIVLIMIVFYFVFLLFQYIFITAEKQSELLKINIVVTVVNIIGNIILIPKYSFVWAWIASVLSQFLLMVLAYYYSRPILTFQIPKKETLLILWSATLIYFWLRGFF